MNIPVGNHRSINIPRWLAFCVLLSLIWSILLAINIFPQLRGDFGWRWGYDTPIWVRIIPVLFAIAIYVVVALRLENPIAVQWWAFAGAIIIPLACLFILGDPLYLLATRTLSAQATGQHFAGTEITDLAATLRNWPAIMPTYVQPDKHQMISVHIALSPPGLPMFYYFVNQILAAAPSFSQQLAAVLRPFQCQNFVIMDYTNPQLASVWIGILMPVWTALIVFPLYRMGGKLAAIWWPLIPSAALFAPDWNTVYALWALIAFLLLDHGLKLWQNNRRIQAGLYLVLAGVVTSACTFANISLVPLIGFLGLYMGFFLLKHIQPLQRMFTQYMIAGVLFVIGTLSLWMVYYAGFGVTPIAVLASALQQHLSLDRPYLPWLYLHLYDLAIFAGLPVVLVALLKIFKELPRRFDVTKLDPLGLSLFLTLVILALSGTARGETGRVWFFFVPFIILLAAQYLSAFPKTTLVILLVCQAFTLVIMVAFLRTVDAQLDAPPSAPPTQQTAADALPAPITFANSFNLIGKYAEPADGGLNLTLSWQATRQVDYPYYLSALLVGPNGQAQPPSVNWQPFDNKYPVTCWRPGQTVTETRYLPLEQDAPPGNYWVSLSAFALVNGKSQPASVTQPGSAPDTQVGLGPIPVP